MSDYIQQCLHKFKNQKPRRPQDAPHPSPLPQSVISAQLLAPTDKSTNLQAEGQTRKIVGSLLFYARAVDNKILKELNTIVRQTGSETDLTEN